MTNHCFISYSTADALEFARKLANKLVGGTPSIPIWFDKDDLRPGDDWDVQIDEALKTCKLVLFVMSTDSVTDNSVCKQEWSRALSYKKPIIPLWFHDGVNAPFRIGDRQRIDFRNNFDKGLAQLREHVIWMDSPEGQLRALKDRLADAQRDLRRANDEDQLRVQAEIDELTAQIKAGEIVKKDPEKAKKQTRRNIDAGLERDRQPISLTSGNNSSKFINPRPGSVPEYFEGRLIETEEIADFLRNDFQKIMTITGRAGSGKTILACRVLQHLENGHFPNELGEFKIGGIVYLSEISNYKINVANIFSGLLQLIESQKANKLEDLYKEAKMPIDEKFRALLAALPAEPVILLADNFENLLGSDDETIIDQELYVALKTILQAEACHLKVLITTRIPPRQLNMFNPAQQYILHLEEGLPSPFAENVLRKMDKDGHAGFRDATVELLGRVREATLGYPRALESLYAILRVDRYSSVEELLVEGLPDTVVEKFVGEAFSRLDSTSQKIVQTLAIYNRPVSSAAVDFALQFHVPCMNSAPILERLVSMHFVRREAKRYFLHPADHDYALSRMPHGDANKKIGQGARARTWNQHSLTLRAADYFVEVRKPRTEWKNLEDLAPQLTEFELRVGAGDYNTAVRVLNEIDFSYLLIWGHNHLTIDLHKQLLGKVTDPNLINWPYWALGLAFGNIGEYQQAIVYSEQALSLARDQKDKESESSLLVNLGNNYGDIGKIDEAIKFYEQGLNIATEINHEHAKGNALSNLGHCYLQLGDALKAIKFLEQGLVVQRKSHDHRNEAVTLGNLGYSFLSLDNFPKAEEQFKQAIEIADQVLYRSIQQNARLGLVEICLAQNDLDNAYFQIDTALQYSGPEDSGFNVYATNLQGIIALRRGDRSEARSCFIRVISEVDKALDKTPGLYSVLDAKGLALCGLALDNGPLAIDREKTVTEAVDAFQKARKIAPHAGIVKSMLRLFDELAKCDEEGILKDVRKAAEGNE